MLVSVVIPTYNPGRYLDPGFESLLAQTLRADQFEIIVVDDGSTDDTPAHLDALAAEHPNIVVVHSEHSGWAGRPRNIGIERARGEFIQFVDQDDRMSPDALRRLVAMGQRNGSDIVLGKVTSDFRGVAVGLYRENRDVCTVHDAPLISSLTPHKMFRRSFLIDNAIRFPEGKRRLEDQLFVVKAYFAARVISIVADEPCYFYLGRDDHGNAGSDPSWDPDGYYQNLREVLDVVVANTQPGEQRAHLMRRFCRAQLVGRLWGRRFLAWEPEFRSRVFDNVRAIMLDYVDEEVDAGLGAVMAVRAALIRAGRLDPLLELYRRADDLVAPSRIVSARWIAGRLEVRFVAEVEHRGGSPFAVGHRDGRTVLDPDFLGDITTDPVDVGDELQRARLRVAVRDTATRIEWRLPTRTTVRSAPIGPGADGWDRVRMIFDGVATLDPEQAAAGQPIPSGAWVWSSRIELLGLSLESPLGATTTAEAGTASVPAYFKPPGHLVAFRSDPGGGAVIDVATVEAAPPGRSIYRPPSGPIWRTRTSATGVARRIYRRFPPRLRRASAGAFRAIRPHGRRSSTGR